jgi:type II secretion system protein H
MVNSVRGVTLIELLVVMAIMAVLLSVTAPSISGAVDNLTLTTSGQRILAAFRSAQRSAMTQGERILVTCDGDSVRFLSNGKTFRVLQLSRGVRVTSPATSATFVFLRSGAMIGPDSLELTNAHGRRIQLTIVHATGALKLERLPQGSS